MISSLRDSDYYERQQLALSTAAELIHRKASYGKEVADHAEELASILTGLHDKFEMQHFQQMRIRAMIAIVVARPLQMGPWFTRAFFDGDYSIHQRTSILTALGFGAGEIAGYKDGDAAITGAESSLAESFPSKKLPDKLHNIYANEVKPVQMLAERLERTMIQPMAAEAADTLAGPNALKVQRVSSRIALEKNRKAPVGNELAKIVGDAFFYPLVGGWWVQMKAL